MRRQAAQRYIRSLTVPGDGPNIPQLGRQIPVPDAPAKPILSLDEFLRRRPADIPSLLDAGKVFHLTTGRVAIALALECLGLKPGQKVLVPAYHCASMIMPLSRVGAEPTYYRIHDDLSVDLDDIETKIDGVTKALMVTHYFGFPQDMPRIRQFCDDRGLALIEDCAHSFFGRIAGRPIGSYGNFAIGSQRKFFPVFDGGCLISPTVSPDRVATREQEFGANLKAVLTLCQDAIGFGRLPALRPFVDGLKSVRDQVRGSATGPDQPNAEASGNPAEDNSGGFGEFDGEWMDKKPMVISRAVIRTFSKGYVIDRRRRNYRALLQGLGNLSGCRLLNPELPDDVVPYMFPIWIDDLDSIFPRLEDEAVPMQRFGQFLAPGIDQSVCEVSTQRSHHSVQLPCHQALSKSDLALIIDRVRRAIQGRPPPQSGSKSVSRSPEKAPVT